MNGIFTLCHETFTFFGENMRSSPTVVYHQHSPHQSACSPAVYACPGQGQRRPCARGKHRTSNVSTQLHLGNSTAQAHSKRGLPTQEEILDRLANSTGSSSQPCDPKPSPSPTYRDFWSPPGDRRQHRTSGNARVFGGQHSSNRIRPRALRWRWPPGDSLRSLLPRACAVRATG